MLDPLLFQCTIQDIKIESELQELMHFVRLLRKQHIFEIFKFEFVKSEECQVGKNRV